MRLRFVPLEILYSPPNFSLVLGLLATGTWYGALFYLGRYSGAWHCDALYMRRLYDLLWESFSD